MALISGFIVFSLVITTAFLVGILTFLTDHEKNGCEMTYMFEYPQYVRVHFKDDRSKKYNVYAYTEGRFIQNTRTMRFHGIPTFFIPGNGGSYKQVRSFASVSLRKSIDLESKYHFDFFTIDLNDELSGLNGALLHEQTEYINSTIFQIFKLYEACNGVQPKNLVLLGHSMGGIIARGLLDSLSGHGITTLVITLATPHARPPIALDTYMTDYYNRIQEPVFNNTAIIAISGGYNDYLITPFIATSKNVEHLHVNAPSIPLVWLPIDHLCILWCKQLVLAVTRGLFDLVDLHTKDMILDTNYFKEVFHHYLVNNNGLKIRNAAQYSQSTELNRRRGEWIENLQKHYTISLKNGVKGTQWHMIRLLNEADYRFLAVITIDLKVTEWIFACSATHIEGQRRICAKGIHLSQMSEIAPSSYKKRRTLFIDAHELKKNYTDITHIVIKVLPTSDDVLIHVDRFPGDDRKVRVNLPSLWSFRRDLILNETQEKFVYYDLMLPQLQQIVQYYKLYVEPIKCNSKTHQATASLIVPWGHQNMHKHFTEADSTPFNVRLHQSRPVAWNDSFPSIRLTLDPSCRYSISIKNNIFGVLGQIARNYMPLVIANMVAVLLLTLRNQMIDIKETGKCSNFFKAIQRGIKPYYILPLVKIASRFLSWKGFAAILPLPDWHIITEEGNEFLLLSFILYVTGVGIVWFASLGVALCLIFCESTFHKLITKILARTIMGSTKLSDLLIGGLHKLPELVATALVIISITTCGGLSLCLGCMFYFLKLTQMSQDYAEQIVFTIIKYFFKKYNAPNQQETSLDDTTNTQDGIDRNAAEKNKQNEAAPNTDQNLISDAVFFHFSIFLLWCIVTGLNIPSVLTWAHNFQYSTTLNPDPSFIPGLILSLCALPLWHFSLPNRDISGYSILAQILSIIAGISLIYASLSLYRLNYIISFAIALVTLHQLFSKKRTVMNNASQPETSYSDIKAKLE